MIVRVLRRHGSSEIEAWMEENRRRKIDRMTYGEEKTSKASEAVHPRN